MSIFIFDQLTFIRRNTVKLIEDLEEMILNKIPTGFSNHLRWQLGHIYTVQERLAFAYAKEPLLLPDGYLEWFGNGTKPSEWTGEPPSLDDLRSMLLNQSSRIKEAFEYRLDEVVEKPFKTSSGLVLETIGELLSFSLYHEGMHFDRMKVYKKLLL